MLIWFSIIGVVSVVWLLSAVFSIPVGLLFLPWRIVYNLTWIALSSKGVEDVSEEVLSSDPTADTSNGVAAEYNDFEDYEYKALPSERHIRILRVHAPRSGREQYVECELLPHHLDRKFTSGMYTAISYTWDDQKPDRFILCEGKRLAVTKNCEAILRLLRPRNLGCVVWIDAICIDQDSRDEKAAQVPLMCDIYKRAHRVVIWLGGPAAKEGLIFKYLWLHWCCLCLPTSSWLTRRLYIYMMRNRHTGLIRELARRTWWQRVWTIQEATLAPNPRILLRETVVRCGKQEVPLDLLTGGVMKLALFDAMTDTTPINHHVWTEYLITHGLSRINKSDIARNAYLMMHRNRACGVSDPKDRVYGFYGMLVEQGLQLPKPSYLKTVDEIYWEFTVKLCQQTQDLKLLQLVSGLGSKLNTPSWVPDFDGPWRAGDSSGRPNATKNSRSQFQFLDNDKTLIVSGKMVDIVYKKSNLTTWQPEGQGAKVQDGPLVNLEVGFMRTVHAFRDWTQLLFNHCGYAIYGDAAGLMNAFGEVLVRGYSVAFFNHDSADNDQAALSTWLGLIHRFLPEEESAKELAYVKKDPLIKEKFYENPELEHLTNIEEWQVLCTLKTLPLTAKLHHAIWMLTRDMIYFTTGRGYMGTGNNVIEEKDVIVLIAGLERPMVLRPINREQDGEELIWRVVGPVWITGMMEGELWENDSELVRFTLV